jgi:hypothetical protein
MKKTKLLFLGVLLFSLFSCKKEANVDNEITPPLSKPKEINLTASTKFLVNGVEEMTYADYENSVKNNLQPNVPAGNSNEQSIIIDFNGNNYIFSNDAQLLNWANSTSGANIFTDKLNEIAQYQTFATNNGMIDDEALTQQYINNIIIPNEPTPNASNPISALYDGYRYTGNFYWWIQPMSWRPSLGDFNDRGSSITDYFIGLRLNMLASRTWFRGRKFFYFSWTQIQDLRVVSFDNTARSKL